jgi:hypothetical protein
MLDTTAAMAAGSWPPFQGLRNRFKPVNAPGPFLAGVIVPNVDLGHALFEYRIHRGARSTQFQAKPKVIEDCAKNRNILRINHLRE